MATRQRVARLASSAAVPRGIEDGARPPGVSVRGGVARAPRPDRERARRGRAHRARVARIVVEARRRRRQRRVPPCAARGRRRRRRRASELVSGSTSRAMGGVRQQFSTARKSSSRARASTSSRGSGRRSSGRSATSSSRRRTRGSRRSRSARALQNELGVRSSGSIRRSCAASRSTTSRARPAAGATASPIRPASRGRSLRLAQERGVVVRDLHARRGCRGRPARDRVRPWSPDSAPVGVELPIRPLCGQLLETSPRRRPAGRAADGDRGGDGLSLSPSRRRSCSR